MVTMQSYTSSSNVIQTRPLSERNQPIEFQSPDGSVGCRAYPINYEELYNLKGRLLTLVDATFTDREQRKAHKDIVWQTLRAWMDDIERAGGVDPLNETPVQSYPADNH